MAPRQQLSTKTEEMLTSLKGPEAQMACMGPMTGQGGLTNSCQLLLQVPNAQACSFLPIFVSSLCHTQFCCECT